jgi:hypothetical protein
MDAIQNGEGKGMTAKQAMNHLICTTNTLILQEYLRFGMIERLFNEIFSALKSTQITRKGRVIYFNTAYSEYCVYQLIYY